MDKRKTWKAAAPCAALAMFLNACGGMGGMARKSDEPPPSAKADVSGYLPNTQEGTIWFTQTTTEGLRIHGNIKGLLPDQTYAVHINEFGSCDNPAASGMHFDPIGSGRHGAPGTELGMRHAGDLPNIETNQDGEATLDFTTNVLGTGTSDFSVIGRSITLSSEPDDYQSQPEGGTGAKIACGVIQPVTPEG
jgi:Cu-Zn family superoxide dismutase